MQVNDATLHIENYISCYNVAFLANSVMLPNDFWILLYVKFKIIKIIISNRRESKHEVS